MEFQACGLQCIRDERVLFNQLNFQLNSGQLMQIEGRNGSGKTSLLRILAGLALATEGNILWNGQDIQDNPQEYRQQLCYLGHTASVKADLTPLENLKMTLALVGQQQVCNLETALNAVGLAGFEDVPTRTLSAGQQRRVALARLWLQDAPLWILDEPFTSLDKAAIRLLEELILRHAEHGGMVILTSHHHVNCNNLHKIDLNALC